MGVTSLIAECLQLGVPVDIAKLTRESMGMTADQVMELRLEQLLLTRKLEISTSEALDLQKQLERVSEKNEKKITHQKHEIRNLKAELEKVKKKLGGPGVQMGSTDDEDFETFDWAADQINTAPPRNGERRPEGEEATPHHEPQANDGVTVNVSTSSPTSAEPDLQSLQPHSRISASGGDRDYDDNWSLVVNVSTINGSSRRKINAGNVTNVSHNHEDMGSSKTKGRQGGEMTSQKEKLKIQKMKKESGNPGVQMESTPETDDLAEGVDSAGNGGLEEGPAPDNESQAGDGEIVDESTLTSGYAERDFQSLRSVPRDEGSKEEDETNSPKPHEDDRVPSGSRKGAILQSKTSAPAYNLRQNRRPSLRIREFDSSRDISAPPDSQSESEKSGSPKGRRISPTKSLRCQRCSKLLKYKWTLHGHLFRVHSNDPALFRCEKCCLSFFSEDELKRHKKDARCRLKIQESSPLKCRYCSKGFKSRSRWHEHQKMHLGRNGEFLQVKCEFCPKSYATLQGLMNHKRLHHSQKI